MAKHLTGSTLGNHPEIYPYVMSHLGELPVQVALRDRVTTEPHARMLGAPDEAAFLGWLVKLTGAKKIVEVGVFRGTTTLALALALPEGGRVIGLDVNDEYCALGREAWAQAQVDEKIEIRVGPGVVSLEKMLADGEAGTVDMIFIDADKENYLEYYEKGLALLRTGGVIAVDNTLWDGLIVQDEAAQTPRTKAICAINNHIRQDKRVSAVLLPIADGCYLVRKL